MPELMPRRGLDVTVVIAAYNASPTLDQALASVAAQTETPAAVIVADDCSADDTAVVAEGWADRLPVEVLRLDRNGGPAVARHRAIEEARTPLVALLDADDYWLPDHLESMLAMHHQQPGVVSADAIPWLPGSVVSPRTFSADRPLPLPGRQLLALIERNVVFMGTLFTRSQYLAVGGFRSQFRGTEDWDLWIRMARAGIPISRPDHPTVLYRMDASSLSSRDGQLDADLAVMEIGLQEAASEVERDAIRRKIGRLACQRSLFDAYDAARDNRPGDARRAAARALRGERRVAARAVAMLVAPRWGERQRDARRYRPQWWFKRI